MTIGDIEARSGRKGSFSTPMPFPPPNKGENGHRGTAVCFFGRVDCAKGNGGGGGGGGGDRRYTDHNA